jgi:hypothetical protein
MRNVSRHFGWVFRWVGPSGNAAYTGPRKHPFGSELAEKRQEQIAYESGERQQAESVMYADLSHDADIRGNKRRVEESILSNDITGSA